MKIKNKKWILASALCGAIGIYGLYNGLNQNRPIQVEQHSRVKELDQTENDIGDLSFSLRDFTYKLKPSELKDIQAKAKTLFTRKDSIEKRIYDVYNSPEAKKEIDLTIKYVFMTSIGFLGSLFSVLYGRTKHPKKS